MPPRLTLRRVLLELACTLILAPAVIALVCVLIGMPLAAGEGWQADTGFYFTMSVILGLTTPLGNAGNVSPHSDFGKLMAAMSGLWSLSVVGVVAAASSQSQVIQTYTEYWANLAASSRRPALNGWLIFAAQTLLISPLAAVLLAGFVGGVLAACEKWKYSEGIFYILADVAGLPNPLVSVAPTATSGRCLDIIFSLWAFLLAGAVVGVAGEMLPDCKLALPGKVAEAGTGTRDPRIEMQPSKEVASSSTVQP